PLAAFPRLDANFEGKLGKVSLELQREPPEGARRAEKVRDLGLCYDAVLLDVHEDLPDSLVRDGTGPTLRSCRRWCRGRFLRAGRRRPADRVPLVGGRALDL